MMMELRDVINALESAPRIGAEVDIPEGSRYVQITETALSLIIESVKAAEVKAA